MRHIIERLYRNLNRFCNDHLHQRGAEFFKLSVIRRTLSVRKDEREYVLSIGSFSTVSFGASFYVLHYPKPFALACPAGCQSDVLLLGRSVQGIGVLVMHRVFHMACGANDGQAIRMDR